MEKKVSLRAEDWSTLLAFVNERTAEIAEFDDEDEIYVAVMAVIAKIELQLSK